MFRCLLLSTFFCVAPAFADWKLEASASTLHFTTIKKDAIGEVMTFKQLQGNISDAGEFEFVIPLASVETLVPIRNQRMQEFLFEVAKFPLAKGTGKVSNINLVSMGVGAVRSLSVPVQIDLHGKKVVKQLSLKVAKLDNNTIWVVTEAPFILDAAEFGLTAGIDKLKELAALSTIAQAVPVTVNLTYKLETKS